MSLLKTLKKRYDAKSTRWGEFFVGPRKAVPIPPNSLILCPNCGEFVAFTTRKIPFERRFYRSPIKQYRERFTEICWKDRPRHYDGDWGVCGNCHHRPEHNGLDQSELFYLPVGPMCLLMALNHRSQDEHAR